jgi:hypothetical protein
MTGPPEPRACELCTMNGATLHGGGPWLIVHGTGAKSEDIANSIVERCTGRHVATRLRTIDDISDLNLGTYTGLTLSLPSILVPDVKDALKPFADLVVDYRARKRPGLDLILNGSCPWFDVGDVRLIGPRALIHHSMMKTARAHACAVHYIDNDLEEIDVFELYTNRGLSLVRQPSEEPGGDIAAENIQRVLRRIEGWGVKTADIPAILDHIDRFRDHYEDERFSQLHRPIPGLLRNRLDIILDGPHDVIIGTSKTWQENGARVARELRTELQKFFPGIARPGNLDKKKDSVKALAGFYRDLKIITKYMRHTAKLHEPATIS